MSQVELILRNSLIGCTKKQKAAVLCLGLKKPGQTVTLKLNPAVQGQIDRVKHLLSIQVVEVVKAEPVKKKVEAKKKVEVEKKSEVKRTVKVQDKKKGRKT